MSFGEDVFRLSMKIGLKLDKIKIQLLTMDGFSTDNVRGCRLKSLKFSAERKMLVTALVLRASLATQPPLQFSFPLI
jgi:hypothetical protein